ncbi:MAG TPA: ATP-dependent sacrificial sulfur transferase LarE [Candidatus Thermoplasmatota archaeon]|nr:ATP-dependent sacrificial sulfur transferase LarE [Candidatus Thermoplasmatota archaeon]
MDPPAGLAALRAAFGARGGVVVGYSGGVDSALLAQTAHDALGARALSVTVDSPSLPRRELAAAEALARERGWRWRAVPARELENPLYVANGADRCFYCREEMSAVLRRVAVQEGLATLAMGVHVDDFAEVRPGHAAMRAAGVWFPLLEVGAGKADVRAMAQALGLKVWDKPAAACLSSRIQHGEPVTVERLRRIEAAEAWLLDQGFRVVRVRARGQRARVEVGPEEVGRLQGNEPAARAALIALGFSAVEIDPLGYRPGAMGAAPLRP